jgi:hypothetical protein
MLAMLLAPFPRFCIPPIIGNTIAARINTTTETARISINVKPPVARFIFSLYCIRFATLNLLNLSRNQGNIVFNFLKNKKATDSRVNACFQNLTTVTLLIRG